MHHTIPSTGLASSICLPVAEAAVPTVSTRCCAILVHRRGSPAASCAGWSRTETRSRRFRRMARRMGGGVVASGSGSASKTMEPTSTQVDRSPLSSDPNCRRLASTRRGTIRKQFGDGARLSAEETETFDRYTYRLKSVFYSVKRLSKNVVDRTTPTIFGPVFGVDGANPKSRPTTRDSLSRSCSYSPHAAPSHTRATC